MENYPRQLVSGDNACTKGTNTEPSQTHYTSTKHMLHTVMPTSIRRQLHYLLAYQVIKATEVLKHLPK